MGCDVYATDVRDIEDQIISVGGKFVHYDPEGLKAAKDSGGYAPKFDDKMQTDQDAMYTKWSAECNIVILTAALPGMPPPHFVSKEMVENMQPGSVIVDLAAGQGGNCELSKPGEDVIENGVRILGPTNLPGDMAYQSSQLYSRNLTEFLLHLVDDEGELKIDVEDELTRGPLVTHAGDILHEPTANMVSADAAPEPPGTSQESDATEEATEAEAASEGGDA